MPVSGLNLKLLKKAIVCRKPWYGSPDTAGLPYRCLKLRG